MNRITPNQVSLKELKPMFDFFERFGYNRISAEIYINQFIADLLNKKLEEIEKIQKAYPIDEYRRLKKVTG